MNNDDKKITGNKIVTSDFLRVLLALKENIMKDLHVAEICKVTSVSDNQIIVNPINNLDFKIFCISLENIQVNINDIVIVLFTNNDFRKNLKRLKSNLNPQKDNTITLHSLEYGIIIAKLFRDETVSNDLYTEIASLKNRVQELENQLNSQGGN